MPRVGIREVFQESALGMGILGNGACGSGIRADVHIATEAGKPRAAAETVITPPIREAGIVRDVECQDTQ